MAAKKETYVCVSELGCGWKSDKTSRWLDKGDSIKLTAKQAKPLLAQNLIQKED